MFNLDISELDTQFGVIPTDPAQGLYTIRIDAKASVQVEKALASRPPDPAEGIFSNPQIDTFGTSEE